MAVEGDAGGGRRCCHLVVAMYRAVMSPGGGPARPALLLLMAAGCFVCAEEILGRLTATQAEANGTSFRYGTFLATKSKVTWSFLIHDPSNFFREAEFSYTWNFGDGTAVMTGEPFTHHSFSKPGNYDPALQVTAHLHGADFEWHVRKKTGRFSASLILQDIIRNITISAPLQTTTNHNVSMTLHIHGSPPLAVCWLIKSDCVSLNEDECRPVIINDTTYLINHIYNIAGRYCLSVKAQNEVSMLVNHYSITVDSAGVHPLWFVIPCCGLIVITVGFIFFTLFRAGSKNIHVKKSLVEVADFDFSPVSDKYETIAEYKEIHAGKVCCAYCSEDRDQEDSEEEAESRPLLHTMSLSARSYTM